MLQIKEAGHFETLNVHIRSEGGQIEEGNGIYDLLRQQAEKGKKIRTIGEGVLKSMATRIFLAGDERELTPNTKPHFHLPLIPETKGNARDLEKQAAYLRQMEEESAKFYSERMGIPFEEAMALMEADSEITYDRCVEIGFVTKKEETKLKAVALVLNNKPKSDMAIAKEIEEAIQKETNGLFDKIKNLMKTAKKPMNIVVQDANGTSLDFADVEGREPEVGDMATVDGTPAEGEYVMTDGRTFVFSAGELTEIKEADGEDEEMEQMKAENEALKAENTTLKAGLDEVKNQFTQLKATMTSAGIQVGKPVAKGTQHKQDPTEPTNRAAGLKDRLKK